MTPEERNEVLEEARIEAAKWNTGKGAAHGIIRLKSQSVEPAGPWLYPCPTCGAGPGRMCHVGYEVHPARAALEREDEAMRKSQPAEPAPGGGADKCGCRVCVEEWTSDLPSQRELACARESCAPELDHFSCKNWRGKVRSATPAASPTGGAAAHWKPTEEPCLFHGDDPCAPTCAGRRKGATPVPAVPLEERPELVEAAGRAIEAAMHMSLPQSFRDAPAVAVLRIVQRQLSTRGSGW
jgi:hypothetical protein